MKKNKAATGKSRAPKSSKREGAARSKRPAARSAARMVRSTSMVKAPSKSRSRSPSRAKPSPAARRAPKHEERRELYPALEPFRHGYLRVSDVHEIYFEECGNPAGKPAVFLHGGPGAGSDKRARQFFDPQHYRIVVFDQRGSGRSRPSASLVENTTWHLVADIERLRKHLGIERWLVFGGSWGSTLALAYSEAHPERVTELILRGIFLLRYAEIRWFYQHGASEVFPDAWEAYRDAIPPDERDDYLSAYHRRLTGTDQRAALGAARAWSMWEASASYLQSNVDNIKKWGEDQFALAVARIECHYFVNRGFLRSESQLLDDVPRIRHIPTTIVQGRYDMVCPVNSAWALHRTFPEAELRLVPDAGHSAFEPGNTHELVLATDRYRSR
ncbi:MAG TPA: prolyl aminopeptidase [Steroidobacteraceae bacterium]|jgi:proline iminopeptidase|nr:prolyl aminopeptidase [Steroidobacteraceae bacterium]